MLRYNARALIWESEIIFAQPYNNWSMLASACWFQLIFVASHKFSYNFLYFLIFGLVFIPRKWRKLVHFFSFFVKKEQCIWMRSLGFWFVYRQCANKCFACNRNGITQICFMYVSSYLYFISVNFFAFISFYENSKRFWYYFIFLDKL